MMSFEYNPPEIGDMVLAIFLSNDSTQGFVIGKPYNDLNRPKNGKKGIVRKDYDIDAFIEYDKATKTLFIEAQNIVFKGHITSKE